MDAPAQVGLRMPDPGHFSSEVRDQLFDVAGAAVAEPPFRERPDAFVGIHFGCVGWEVFDRETRMTVLEQLDRRALVYPGVVEQRNHGATKMAEQVLQEQADLHVSDVVEEEEIVEFESLPDGADGDPGNDRHLVASIRVLDQRRLPPRGPGADSVRDQKEAGFVAEDEVGTQPRGVFFTLGQSSAFQRSISLSPLRSVARLSGFWGVQSRLCMRRPTWSG